MQITNSLERIEFLGDAIIDYLVTCYIFSEYGTCLTPGEVTNLRSALVNNNTLAKIAVDTRIYTELQVRNRTFSSNYGLVFYAHIILLMT